MQLQKVLADFKDQGRKITKIRSEVIKIISESKSPISAPKIIERLRDIEITANKTTVYRELAFLLSQEVIREVKLSPYITHYESSDLTHHHHLVCEDCGDVEEVICTEIESPIGKFAKRVLRKGFEIKNHNLEFYGICSSCR